MIKSLVFGLAAMAAFAVSAEAQIAALDEAKYITTLKVVTDHKMKDADLEPDVDRLRENERFKKELIKMLGKLDGAIKVWKEKETVFAWAERIPDAVILKE